VPGEKKELTKGQRAGRPILNVRYGLLNNSGGRYAMPRLAVKNRANLGCQMRIRTRTMFMRIESLR
jgi:hypothetical protein